MGSNRSGFQNEDDLMYAINNKSFCELNLNLQSFIYNIYPCVKDSDIITCKKIAGQNKCDLQIKINGQGYRISVKKGSGNSVHQEPVESFIYYLKCEFNLSDSLANDIRFFIWGDGTLNGTGTKKNRLNVDQLKKQYPKMIQQIRNFFELNKEPLIKRFLLTGACGDAIDFIYYGNENNGLWASRDEFIKVVLDNPPNNRTAIPVGRLSFQAWNRAINGTKSENKRGVIQLKWASLQKDLQYITSNRK
ncbi:hypothetical protein DFH04_07395 [Clostridium novyi]|uniref:hypothetical protein n=1 Tax=Clostridium novyi TaxID=1542 RepID=UPI000EA217A8|nr:hypothetical protein [Clostridium novyi]AYF54541.1 hypothetical protein DFH04_07395 [Clostridium novyi]